MLTIFFATYGAVFVAEIVGDKLLYTTGVLATRYKTLPIMVGMAAAFMLKMGVAVAVGEAISKLPAWLVACVTAASFIGVAITVWRKDERRSTQQPVSAPRAAMVSFAAIFFSEWGDVGQITAAAMSAKFHVPVLVWAGAVAAMVTKGVLAASIGAGVRGWIQAHIPPRIIRYAGVGALVLLGILSVIETLTEGHA
jgi:putative Ca2+/H+ antiporter (TMEM165/GDT1 family)